MRPGMISPKAGRKLAAKTAKRSAFNARQRDEGELDNYGLADETTINDARFQRGGRVSRSGGAGPERQEHRRHIDKAANRREWPAGAQVSSSNPKTGNSRMLGGLAGSNGNGAPGNWYSAGPGRRWG